MRRSTAAAVVLLVLGCAHAGAQPSDPPTGSTAADPSPATLVLTGRLSRKGASPVSYWAVTDDTGQVWEILEGPPEIEAALLRLQNSRVTLRVRRMGKTLLERVVILEIVSPRP
jgi:hypothetical protein